MSSQRWPINRDLLLESFVESVIVWGAVVAFFGIIAGIVYFYDSPKLYVHVIMCYINSYESTPTKRVDKAVRKWRTKIKYVLVSGPPAFVLV